MKISLSSDHIIIKQFIDSTLFSFYKLKNLINEIKTYSFYSKYYEELLIILEDFNEKITNRFKRLNLEILEQIKSIEKNESEYETVEDIFNKYYTSLKRNNQYLAFFNVIVSTFMNADNFYIHQGNFILIEEFIKKISPDSKFIIYPYFPRAGINYGFQEISNLLEKFGFMKEISIEEMKNFLVFAVPAVNKEDILSNSLLGHEIGHFINNKKQISVSILKERFPLKVFEDNIEDWIKQDLSLDSAIKSGFLKDLYIFEKWHNIISNWTKEIVCDKIGLRIFGLSYLFAFVDFVYINKGNVEGTEKHPPNWLRIKILIDEVRDDKREISEFIKNLEINGEKLDNKINKIISFVQNNFTKEKQQKYKINQKTELKKEIDFFKQYAISFINNKEFYHDYINLRLDEYINEYCYCFEIDEIVKLIELLDLYIVPNEIINSEDQHSHPSNFITILNAGWLYFLFRMKNHYEIFKDTDKMEVRNKLNELLLKAIELSKIQQTFNNILEDIISDKIFEIFKLINIPKKIERLELIGRLESENNSFYHQIIIETIEDLINKKKLIKKNGYLIVNINFKFIN